LELSIAEEELWVNGDAQRLAQAVGNLLHNALKFTSAGGQTEIKVSREQGTEAAIISVSDTGIGIGPDALSRLFEPFMQVDNAIDRSRGGLGLGLALVKSLVEMHDGIVRAASDGTGQGATFTIRLPLCATPAPPRAMAPAGSPRPRRILIIEDNVDAAESLCEALTLSGHEVQVAYDGTDGVEKARQFEPDIVLCDIGLPGMTGYDVARALRLDATLNSVHLVALSGYGLPEDLAKASAAGFDLHVAKPPDPEKLQ
jgi:CheY-like chemotaxis protein/anti-sigma regulatory factor (Ser/Thr protein kinase)